MINFSVFLHSTFSSNSNSRHQQSKRLPLFYKNRNDKKIRCSANNINDPHPPQKKKEKEKEKEKHICVHKQHTSKKA